MQSGTTAINTLRIYSPTKQAQDHDPEGIFIRRWVPELARVPLEFLAQPWRMDGAQQGIAGCVIGRDYPEPIVIEKDAVAQAKIVLYGLRKAPQAQAEADAIAQRHGSRKSGLPPSGRSSSGRSSSVQSSSVQKSTRRRLVDPPSGQQLELFDLNDV